MLGWKMFAGGWLGKGSSWIAGACSGGTVEDAGGRSSISIGVTA